MSHQKKRSRFKVDDVGTNEQIREQSKKSFHTKDLVRISPLTDAQEEFFRIYSTDIPVIAAIGSAGTGKTFLSLFLALRDVLSQYNGYKKVILVRSCVPGRDMGFLPGTVEEKEAIYELPYHVICRELLHFENSYENLKALHHLNFISTSFLRGLTFEHAIVIVDEIQNMSFEELNTVMTRLGNHSRIIFCGDIAQNDLVKSKYDKSGFDCFLKIIEDMKDAAVVKFTRDDIVRSNIIKQYLIAKEKHHDGSS